MAEVDELNRVEQPLSERAQSYTDFINSEEYIVEQARIERDPVL